MGTVHRVNCRIIDVHLAGFPYYMHRVCSSPPVHHYVFLSEAHHWPPTQPPTHSPVDDSFFSLSPRKQHVPFFLCVSVIFVPLFNSEESSATSIWRAISEKQNRARDENDDDEQRGKTAKYPLSPSSVFFLCSTCRACEPGWRRGPSPGHRAHPRGGICRST